MNTLSNNDLSHLRMWHKKLDAINKLLAQKTGIDNPELDSYKKGFTFAEKVSIELERSAYILTHSNLGDTGSGVVLFNGTSQIDVGGIEKGTIFVDTPVAEMWEKLLGPAISKKIFDSYTTVEKALETITPENRYVGLIVVIEKGPEDKQTIYWFDNGIEDEDFVELPIQGKDGKPGENGIGIDGKPGDPGKPGINGKDGKDAVAYTFKGTLDDDSELYDKIPTAEVNDAYIIKDNEEVHNIWIFNGESFNNVGPIAGMNGSTILEKTTFEFEAIDEEDPRNDGFYFVLDEES